MLTTGSDAPHRHHEGEKDVTHMKNLMHTHSSGVTYSDIHSNLTEDSLRGFGTTTSYEVMKSINAPILPKDSKTQQGTIFTYGDFAISV